MNNIARGETSARSRATDATMGMLRSARNMPPGPIESAMCIKTPCLPGTSMSDSHAAMPPTEMATMAKCTSCRASRWFVVATTESLRPSADASSVASSDITRRRSESMSISRNSASSNAVELEHPAHQAGDEHAAPTADYGDGDAGHSKPPDCGAWGMTGPDRCSGTLTAPRSGSRTRRAATQPRLGRGLSSPVGGGGA